MRVGCSVKAMEARIRMARRSLVLPPIYLRRLRLRQSHPGQMGGGRRCVCYDELLNRMYCSGPTRTMATVFSPRPGFATLIPLVSTYTGLDRDYALPPMDGHSRARRLRHPGYTLLTTRENHDMDDKD